MKETAEFLRIVNRLSDTMKTLMPLAASEAVRFSKERFVAQNWLGERTEPWRKRKPVKNKRNKGRAILVDTATLKRDIQKISVSETTAVIGTSMLTAGYAKAHNEGFKGTVVVKQHLRARFKQVKETYTTKKGNTRTRMSKQVDTDKQAIVVRTHNRNMKLPRRQFLGQSPVLDARIERVITARIIKAIKG